MDRPQPAPLPGKLKVDSDILDDLNQQKEEIIKRLKKSTITDEDLPDLEPYPSDYLMAHFATEVYKDKDKFVYPAGWELLIPVAKKGNSENGYVGAAFFNTSQQEIIIAHCGTKGCSLKDMWTNLKGVVWGSVPSEIYSALTFADFIRGVIVELQSEKKWRYQLSFTGHSLGGFLAQVTTFGVKYLTQGTDVFKKSTDGGIHSHCVTFDNPGCKEMLEQITDDCGLRYLRIMFPSVLDITTYLSTPNVVNTCNRHVGVLLRVKQSFQEMSEWSANTPHYHQETHNMNTIKNAFDPDEEKINVEIDQILDWPNNTIVYSNEEYKKFFEFSEKKTDNEVTHVPIEGDHFKKVRFSSKKRSVNSCNVALFSGDELFLLKLWLSIIKSPIKSDEKFKPLNLPFKDLFSPFEQFGDDLHFDDEEKMKQTIKRCKRIVRWYPEEIENYFQSSRKVIMEIASDSYRQSSQADIKKIAVVLYKESLNNNCNVEFNDSIKLEDFLEAEENVLVIKSSARNYQIEMLRLFNIFKRIRSAHCVNIDKYIGEDRFLFVNQSYLLMLLLYKYTEIDLLRSKLLKLLFVDLLNETVAEDVSKLIKEFAKNDRKVVIITTSEIDLSSTAFNEITAPDFKFSDLTENSRKYVLENYEIIKLGNQTYTLETFLGTDNKNWAEELTFLDDYEFLDRILNDRCIQLKNDSPNLSKLEIFYIQANDEQNYSIDDFVKLMRNAECDLNESKILVTHVSNLPHAIEEVQNVCDKLQTADLEEASQYFKERCDEESSSKFYWFHYDRNFSLKQIYNPKLYIPRSFYYEMILDETKITIPIKGELLRQEETRPDRVTVELTKTNGRSLKCSFTVKRKRDQITYHWDGLDNNEISDVREFLTISHDGSLTEQELADRRLVLITGEPGIGKSTTVTNILSKNERRWIFKLTYDDCTRIVKRSNGNFDVDQISRQLLRIKSNDQFDFLKYQLVHETPIKVLFLFDELFDSSYDKNYEERIIEFLQYLCDETESFVIVTARETKREMIENSLNIFSLQFKKFDPKDVERYLTNYWGELFHFDLILHRLTLKELDDYKKRLLAKAEEIFNRQILNLIGIPLQIKLLAEVTAPNYAFLSQQSSNLIPSGLTEIYEAFVEKKYDIVCNKSGVRGLYSVKRVYLRAIDKKLQDFSASKYGFYSKDEFTFEELKVLQQTGLIQGSEFIHQTFQEFYFARQIFAWLKKPVERREDMLSKLEEFLLHIFAVPHVNVVRMFLDKYISKITPEDVPFYSRKIAEIWTAPSIFVTRTFEQDSLHALILEHCQGIVIFLLESFKRYNPEILSPSLIKINKSHETVLYLACQTNQTLLIDYFVQLLEAESQEMQNEIIIASFYRLPDEKLLNALENFIDRIPPSSSIIEDITDLIKNEIGLLSDITNAAQSGSWEIVRDRLTNVSETLKPHLLKAINEHAEIVRLLIEHGSNVNQENVKGMTPITLVSETGNIETVRYLTEQGSDYKKNVKLPSLEDNEFSDRIMDDRCIELKNDSPNLSKLENFYIQADDEQNYSDDEFIKLTQNSECDLNESKILITHVSDLPPEIEQLQISCDKLKTVDLNEASQYFKERCDEESSRKFYWFHYDRNFSLKQIYNPRLYIPRLFNEMVLDETKITIPIKEELYRQEEKRPDRVTVELTKTNGRSLKCSFTVKRKRDQITYHWDGLDNNNNNENEISDVREFLTTSHDGSLAEQELAERRLVLITGDPGIGKTTTVTNILSKNERRWIFKLTYDDCTRIVENLNGKFDVDQIVEQLLRNKSNYKSDFLKYQLAHKTQIKVVFLFDELFDSSYDKNYEDRIIKFLQYLCDETESFVFITARENKREMIENSLNIFSLQFKKFRRQDVERYLTKYWSELFHLDLLLNRLTLERLEDYTTKLLKKAEIFNRRIHNLIGIPLQIKLLAEVAAPDYASLSQQSSELIPLELPDNLTEIYEVFVEKKLAIVCKKSAVGESHAVKKIFRESIEKKLRAFAASKYGFHDDDFGELDTLQQTGLVQGSEFIHQTIQEFYFARQLFAWLKKRNGRQEDNQPNLVEFLLEKIFDSSEFSVDRTFLETYISKITPEDAPFYSRKIAEFLMELILKAWGREDYKSIYHHETPLQIFHTLIQKHCQGIVRFLLESLRNHCTTENFLSLLTESIEDNKTVLYLACESNQTLLIDYFVRFLEAQSNEIQNEIMCTSFSFNQSSFSVDIEEKLSAIKNFTARVRPSSHIKGIADLIKNEIGLLSDLSFAAQEGSSEIVRDCLTNVKDTFKPHSLKARTDVHDGFSALHLAVKYGHAEIVRFLIEHGSDVNQKNFDSTTPINLATETGNVEILRYLIENGGDYKKVDDEDEGIAPFHRAAAGGHADVVTYFLEELKYKEVNETDSVGDTALHHAVENRRNGVVEILLKHRGIDVDAKNIGGMRPLDCAINMEDFKLVKMIVEAGASIDCEDEKDDNLLKDFKWIPPVARTSEYGNLEILRYLIEQGADYKKGNDEGITPFHRAAAQGHADVVIYFLEELKYEAVNEKDSDGNTALHYAVKKEQKSVVEILLKHDEIDLDAKDLGGMRPLNYAIDMGDLALVKMIVEAGATIDCEYEQIDDFLEYFNWIPPICRASETGNLEILRYLIENGGDYKKGGNRGVTPFHRAVARGNADIVKYFLEKLNNEEVNEKDSFGNTALHYAVKKEQKGVVEILLKHDEIDVDAKNRKGMRPLDYAVDREDVELVEMIVEAGATIDCEHKKDDSLVRGFKWISPVSRATTAGNLELLHYLIENGGDYKKGDNRRVTPFHRAAARGNADIVEYFLEKLKYEEMNEKDLFGNTALHYAVRYKRKGVLEILLKHDGIDVNAENRFKKRPLDYAMYGGDFKLVEMIVEAGATITRTKTKCPRSKEQKTSARRILSNI